MSKRWTIVLFSTVFLALFVFFQFEAESRRRVRRVDSRIAALELQVKSLSRTLASQANNNGLLELQRTQDALIQEFRTHRARVTELLEILVTKQEHFEQALAKQGERLRVDARKNADEGRDFEPKPLSTTKATAPVANPLSK